MVYINTKHSSRVDWETKMEQSFFSCFRMGNSMNNQELIMVLSRFLQSVFLSFWEDS